MAKKVIKISSLSVSEIRKAQRELEKYRDSLEYKARLLAEKLAERGVEIARVRVASLDAVFTGELIESIHSEYKGSQKNGAVFAVVADSDHAAFVEFGTGMIGQESPYPYELPEGVTWNYNSGKSIRQALEDIKVRGQTYVKAGEYFWSYIGKDGKLHITKGLPSRPYFYETILELQKIVVEVAKEVFGK